jgi:hypothetical protein
MVAVVPANGSLRLSVEMTLPARQQGATVDPTRGRKKRFFGCTCCGQPRRPVRIAHAHQLAPGTEIDDYIPDFPIGAVDADLLFVISGFVMVVLS